MRTPQKIGLIAGGGILPHEVIAGAHQQGFEVFIAVIEGFATPDDFPEPAQVFGLGEIGRLINTFKTENCTHIVLAGNIERPDFKTIKPDLRGLKLLPKVIKAATKGDDALLRLLLSVFEKEGFEILAPQDLCSSSLIGAGVFGRVSPHEDNVADIQKAREIAAMIGAHDIGQGCVVCNGLVLAVEAQEGTDKMLERVAALPENVRGSSGHRQGVLAKRLKPGQEDRVDLPTIGRMTIEHAVKAGLAGIVVEAHKAFIMDKEAVRTLADQHGIFILGYEDV
ncbi:MAG: UDP-2,3-diacylglucosamine pyrophosphatase [Robiginitomaculum sp.]|nr:MAG: UDP-2,3-diacylglucosamine pyrophosphatase [Robiginitomaculum sp.]